MKALAFRQLCVLWGPLVSAAPTLSALHVCHAQQLHAGSSWRHSVRFVVQHTPPVGQADMRRGTLLPAGATHQYAQGMLCVL